MTVVERATRDRAQTEPGRDPATGRGGPPLRRQTDLAGAALAGCVCVLVGVVAIALPTILTWAVDTRSTATLGQTLGVAVDVWALAHRAEIRTPGADLVIAPLLLTAVPLLLCWYAARQVVLGRPAVRTPRVGGWRAAWGALNGADALIFVLGYLLTGLLVAHLSGVGIAAVRLSTLVPGAVLVPTVAVALVWWGQHRREQHPSVGAGLAWVRGRTPVLVRRALPPAGEVLLALATVCFLLVLGLLLLRGERILTLYDSLDAGLVGTLTLSLGQLLALPNLMVWALAWLTGSGVTVGTVHVDWTRSTPGDLPLLPVLGALPEPGALPPGLWAAVGVPLLAGAWIGYRSASSASRLSSWWTKARTTLASCAVVALVVLVLSWAATGGLTPGLLGTVGVEPWRVAGLLLAELVTGGLLVMSALHLARRRL